MNTADSISGRTTANHSLRAVSVFSTVRRRENPNSCCVHFIRVIRLIIFEGLVVGLTLEV